MNTGEHNVILGIDFGTVRVGLALARHGFAQPLYTLSQDDQLLQKLEELIVKEQVTELVVGVSEGNSGERAKDFAQLLQQKLNLPTTLADETLSTQEAITKLKEQNKYKPGMIVDHYAAAVMLEQWCDLLQ